MNRHHLAIGLGLAVVLALSGFGLYKLGVSKGAKMAAHSNTVAAPTLAPQKPGDIDPATGKRVLYWHDLMAPGRKFDKPGKSPYMDMQLTPVYADDAADTAGSADKTGAGGVTISARVRQSLGVRTAEVTRGTLQLPVEAPGSVDYNERDVAVVQARANGFIERLRVRVALVHVQQGQPLAELYAPEWVAAQEEYLSVRRMQSPGLEGLLDGARQRMRLAGMTDDQIAEVEARGKVQRRLTITAPISGVVSELEAREGMTVMAGAPLFRITGLGTVWVNAELPETVAAQVRPGNSVEARTPALPGRIFTGKVNAILPRVSLTTRTVTARVELANPRGELAPGMFATLRFATDGRKDVLLVPSEAIIQTGTRSVVMRTDGAGRFTPANVEVGLERGGQTEILSGLEAGQQVVISGQFLIDSEASLKGVEARLNVAPDMKMNPDKVNK